MNRRQQIQLTPEEQAAFLREHHKAAFAFRAEGRDNKAPTPGAVASAPKRVVLKILPHRVTSWDHRKLGGGY